jgi:acetoin utilization deacetylase AcuC-like enzyme
VGAGVGATLNIAIAPKSSWDGAGAGAGVGAAKDDAAAVSGAETYRQALTRALAAISAFGAEVLVVSLGLDTLRGDPVQLPEAKMMLDIGDYTQMGRMIGGLNLPTIIIQEGGYMVKAEGGVGEAAANVLKGGWSNA